jgi:hypothetical protein
LNLPSGGATKSQWGRAGAAHWAGKCDEAGPMTITATRTPTTLGASNFLPFPIVIDPADGTVQTALTQYNFDVSGALPFRTVDGRRAVRETFNIRITPVCMITVGTTLTPGLRDHEQFHYDVGFVIARQVARVLTDLRRDNDAALLAAVQETVRLHFRTRNNLIQRRYDADTRHGTNAHYQGIWVRRMRDVLANPASTQIGGFFL